MSVVLFAIISRGIIALAAGEVAIRYFVWWVVLLRSGERLITTPVVFGAAAVAFFTCGNYIQLISSDAPLPFTWGLTIVRGLLAFVFLYQAYPTIKIAYNSSLERAMVEMAVRVFLIAISAFITYEATISYATHTLCK